MNNELLKSVHVYVSDGFRTNFLPYLTYHNLLHTQTVVAHCQEISDHYKSEQKIEKATASI